MNQVKNSPFLYFMGGIIAVFVISQSLFFLIRAINQGKKLGIESSTIKKTIISSIIFSITPSISILIGLITLSKALGVALPWIRLSVLGAVTYELPAAETAARAFGLSISDTINDPKVFSAIIWVMSIGCIIPLIIIPLFLKKFQKGFDSIKKNDKKWGDILMSALFLGMISAFLGMGVSNGIISVLTLISSATIMIVCGLLVKKGGLNWLKNYALPFSMIGAMAIAIILNKVI